MRGSHERVRKSEMVVALVGAKAVVGRAVQA
jgi:hypothetical protein